MRHDGTPNLLPVRNKEEARERGKKGGKASGEARRRKKTFQELTKLFLNQAIPDDKKELLKKILPDVDVEDFTYRSGIILKQLEKAFSGNLDAAIFVRDTSGEKPKDSIDLNNKITGIKINFASPINNNSDDKKNVDADQSDSDVILTSDDKEKTAT